jgi:hypothetical protein
VNCKKGDIAFIKSTHPLKHLHGLMVECVEYIGELYGEQECWHFKFASGNSHAGDDGNKYSFGYIQDKHLRPIKGDVSDDETSEADDLVLQAIL